MKKIPRATYRMQFHSGFTFYDAAGLSDYLEALGISHLYSSPCLKAVKGSTHGYDVVDHSRVNEELGGEAGRRVLCEALARRGLGMVLDIVPNHMAVGTPENRWWWDVLENGPSSPYAAYFDVDWNPPEDRLANKILLPILEDHYGRVIEAGKVRVLREGARFVIQYAGHRLPVAPRSLSALLAEAAERASSDELAFFSEALSALPLPTSTDAASIRRRQRDRRVIGGQLSELLERAPACARALDEVVEEENRSIDRLDFFLDQQNYRLAYWRAGAHELGYRRFFDIAALAGLRIEFEQVFLETHARILEWVRDGSLDGLRIDHPDGLRDPGEYLTRLRRAAPHAWIVVEKILQPGERLPDGWDAAGTTGYDFLNLLGGLFVHSAGKEPLSAFYADFCGERSEYAAIALEKKRQVLAELFGSEVNRLTEQLVQICERHRRYRDYTRHDIQGALREIMACFDVYRTYVRPGEGPVREQDRAVIVEAVERASENRAEIETDLFGFIGKILLMEVRGEAEAEFVLRFQQVTGPVAAKGLEDTTFYCYNRLIGLNEVGGDPAAFGVSLQAFHEAMLEKVRREPHGMLSTSTHDTKRSEDVRARLALLSEIPADWGRAVRAWSLENERYRRAGIPDRNFEYLLYQTLVGAWPIEPKRVRTFALKAAREAKTHTSWTKPVREYEAGLDRFVQLIMQNEAFHSKIEDFVQKLVLPGRLNSLSQMLIKLTAPGVPDLYQGSELWDHSLVDPDNRRPVDFSLRQRLLSELKELGPADVLARMDEGLPKLWLIQKTLELRKRREAFFLSQDYAPLYACGRKAEAVVAFSRAGKVVVVAPRFPLKGGGEWGDTSLALPPGRWRDAFSDARFEGGERRVADLLRLFPVGLLCEEDKQSPSRK
ncbi:malto-oligosyltrehalose synthase [Desulfatiglans anilini]|uniref:malto-oligosyltrehalose synthase n=1 Tax=Desulfatiglans anilini TaxID=90728 RepID=UPI00042877A1|nr:malto-oligosyltrehalose synthase [Desulfatiglans anilini]